MCLFLLEHVLAHLADGADPALGDLIPGGAGGHAVVGISHGGVIDVPAGAYAFIHFVLTIFVSLASTQG